MWLAHTIICPFFSFSPFLNAAVFFIIFNEFVWRFASRLHNENLPKNKSLRLKMKIAPWQKYVTCIWKWNSRDEFAIHFFFVHHISIIDWNYISKNIYFNRQNISHDMAADWWWCRDVWYIDWIFSIMCHNFPIVSAVTKSFNKWRSRFELLFYNLD